MKHLFPILWRGCIVLVLFIVLVFVIIKIQSDAYIRTVQKLPHAHTAIVLGANVSQNGRISVVFKD